MLRSALLMLRCCTYSYEYVRSAHASDWPLINASCLPLECFACCICCCLLYKPRILFAMSSLAFVPSSARRDGRCQSRKRCPSPFHPIQVLPPIDNVGAHSLQALSLSSLPQQFESGNIVTDVGATPIFALVAIVIGFFAQTFINSMLKGDRGLGAFLSDGSGYSGSAFRPRRSGDRSDTDAPLSGPDPLPWLKLPKLDFVEVAGQQESASISNGLSPEKEAEIVAQLEELQSVLQSEINAGNVEEANRLRQRLEALMNDYGFQYEADRNNNRSS